MVAWTVTAHGSLKRSGVQFLLTQKQSTLLVFAQRSPLSRAKTHAAMELFHPI
ncbi:hypothetical protein T439DRAFT_329919 [Meredithblackwellia eburnea MCA 4105]